MNTMPENDVKHYDVVIIGGALSGAATATLLLRNNPGIRVLIVEKTAKLSRRVGEATVEVSAFFMGRVLGLTQYLNESHIVKQGLRFWFKNDEVENISQASELGARYQVRLPSYQLDRAAFDEEVLRRAGLGGAEILRPATVSNVRLTPGGGQALTVRHGDATHEVRARWIVDASGVAALLARQNGWWTSNTAHPTAATWSRWKGVKDWDSREFTEKYPEWSKAVYGVRGTATNHVIGDGWWSWWIPLKGGDMSVGVVFDQRIVKWNEEGATVGDRLKNFLMKHPVAREMIADAQYDPQDVHWRKNLAYYSTTFAGDGFVLVGDAAAFMDPFYSPGMDWVSFTAYSAADLITAQRNGEPVAGRLPEYNRKFSVSHRSWFESVYQDKYEYMGEWDLMSTAFLLDLGLYYLGIVSQPFKLGEKALLIPPFSPAVARPVFLLMRTYNRRFAKIARRRRSLNLLGRKNRGHRCLTGGFTLESGALKLLFKTLLQWAWLEITEGYHSWGKSFEGETPRPAPLKPAAMEEPSS